jgi:hypothetical protein
MIANASPSTIDSAAITTLRVSVRSGGIPRRLPARSLVQFADTAFARRRAGIAYAGP